MGGGEEWKTQTQMEGEQDSVNSMLEWMGRLGLEGEQLLYGLLLLFQWALTASKMMKLLLFVQWELTVGKRSSRLCIAQLTSYSKFSVVNIYIVLKWRPFYRRCAHHTMHFSILMIHTVQ